jgi:RNA polymerase sporulation-specific sigma factor
LWERRIICAARDGEPAAQRRLLMLYEAMLRHIVGRLYLPGGDRDDLLQETRLALLDASRRWDPARKVPFRCFAWLCAQREARERVTSARSHKHQVLTAALSLDWHTGQGSPRDGLSFEPAEGSKELPEPLASVETDPVAKVIARERLLFVVACTRMLSQLERRALAGSANDQSRREIADRLGIRERGVNNALQRARRKLDDAA